MTTYRVPKHLDDVRYGGACAACGVPVLAGASGWLHNGKLYCEACKPGDGVAQARLEPNVPPPVPIAYGKCSLCGEQVPEKELGYFTNAKLESFRVCGFCRRVNTCAAYSKIAGLWVVTKRPEAENT